MKPGFSLIELIVAIAFAGLIGSALFTSLFFFNKGTSIANRLMSIDSKAALVQNQMDKDISGAFIPYFAKASSSAKATEDRSKGRPLQKGETSEKSKKESDKKDKKEKKGEQKKSPYEALKDACVVKKEDGVVSLLSFVSSNPLASYGSTMPRMVRISYNIVPEKKRTDDMPSFKLLRQETEQVKFEPKDDSKPEGVLMVSGMKDFKLEFEVRVVQEKKDPSTLELRRTSGSKDKQEESQKISFERVNTWGAEQIEKYKKQLPNFVIAKITFWDENKKTSRPFEFWFPIIADDSPPVQLKSVSRLRPKKLPAGAKTDSVGQVARASNFAKATKDKRVARIKAARPRGRKGNPNANSLVGKMTKPRNNTQAAVVAKNKQGNSEQGWCEI